MLEGIHRGSYTTLMSDTPFPIVDALFNDPTSRALFTANGFSAFDVERRRAILSERSGKAGISAETFFNNKVPSLLQESDKASFSSLVAKLMRGETDRAAGNFKFLLEKDRALWLNLSMQVVGWKDGDRPSFIVVHDDDITQLQNIQEEVRERLMEIDSLKDLLTAINKSLDFDETVTRIIEHLHRIIPFDRATVQILEGSVLAVIGSYGYPSAKMKELHFEVHGLDNPSSRAVATRRPIVCNDVARDFMGFIQMDDSPLVRSWLGIPLVYEGRSIGLFALDSFKPNFYDDRHVRIASTLADQIAIAVQHARQHSMVKEEARTDKLTGVANRYGLETMGQEIFQRCSKMDQALGVLMIDIDFFKKVNDSRGHAYGDVVLKVMAQGIQQSLRTRDYLVRYGGEEFLVLLPDTSTRETLVVAERLRETVPTLEVEPGSYCPTMSVGVFSGVPGAQDFLHEFVHRADIALYEAKQAGRNRCRVWTPKPEFFDLSQNQIKV